MHGTDAKTVIGAPRLVYGDPVAGILGETRTSKGSYLSSPLSKVRLFTELGNSQESVALPPFEEGGLLEMLSMKLAGLFSGGKDSTYSLYKAIALGHEIVLLLTMVPRRSDSWMFHHPCIDITRLQARSAGIRHVMKATEGEKEKELSDLQEALQETKDQINGVLSGGIASSYQKSRIDMICERLGLTHFAPLWLRDPEQVLREEVDLGFKIIFTGVYAEGFGESWLGRRIDSGTIEDLKRLNRELGVHLSGEGGCYETLVLDCPLFKKRIEILESRKIWDRTSGYLEITKAILAPKTER